MPYKNKEDRNRCQKRFYEKNKEYYIEKAKKQKQKARDLFLEYKKTLKCEVCGEDCYYCLDFHHRDPNKKENIVSRLSTTGCSMKKMLKEIEKCVVLCANCHRKVHGNVIKL